MSKVFSCCFLFFVFSISLFLPNLTLKEVLSENILNSETYSSTGTSVLASKIGLKEVSSSVFQDENNVIIGEMVELNIGRFGLNKIIDKLGLLVTKKLDLNSCIIISGITKLLPYKNNNDNYNVQLKVYNDSMLIASPKFMNE